jgi:hypothetical protein
MLCICSIRLQFVISIFLISLDFQDGQTALHFAKQNGALGVVRLLEVRMHAFLNVSRQKEIVISSRM